MDIQTIFDENIDKYFFGKKFYEVFCDGIKFQKISNENKTMKMESLKKNYDLWKVEYMLEYTKTKAAELNKEIGDHYLNFYYKWLKENDPKEYDLVVDIFEENEKKIISAQNVFDIKTNPFDSNSFSKPIPIQEMMNYSFDIDIAKDEREKLKELVLKKAIQVYYNKKLWGKDQEDIQKLLKELKTLIYDVSLFQEFINNNDENNSQMAIEEVDAGSKERVVRTRMSSR